MALLTRRRVLGLVGLGAGALLAARLLLPRWLAVPDPTPLDDETADFVARRLDGLDLDAVWDAHVHVFGVGHGGTGCSVSDELTSHWHPWSRLQYEVYLAASGLDEDDADLDSRYLERLLALHRGGPRRGRLVLLAFDHRVDEDGVVDEGAVPYHTPSDYVLDLAERHHDLEAGVSIHPWREDAVERLDRAVARGARLVKWLPAVMGIDPASSLCDPFYERLADHDLPLLSHAGHEAAVAGAADQAWGNPLRLRRPLEHGVRVVVAHAASFGDDEDLDRPPGRRREVPSFELFLRMLRERPDDDRLLADVSAITQVNRCGDPLAALLADVPHERLLNGSDYPLPAVGPLVSTAWLEHLGYLSGSDRRLCDRVRTHNPLLFDLVLKRCLRIGERRFGREVFETRRILARA